ncbi:hypothetical protein DRQ07_08430 [candidate division KSB1 bacterium]|nr:MAG: hypothetical protein DRQ07_08430 [candidate division KSB1 bacterium]
MDKRKKASALSYDVEKDAAPKVVAKGRGRIAEKIIETAKEHGITVVENRQLAELLDNVDIDDIIPVELYSAVAEILVFLYNSDKQYGEIKRRPT